MADNEVTGSGKAVATDKVTYSGDADQNVQLFKPVLVTGAEGSKTVVEPTGDATNGWDVDVTRVIPGTGATNLGKAEDAGHTTGDVGVMVLGVRNDADADLAGNDLDYIPVSADAAGNQNIRSRRDLTRIAVTSAGLTIATTAYVTGDQVGTQFTFANAARKSGGTGMIVGVTLINAHLTLTGAEVIGAYDVVISRASLTLAGDNVAWAVNDADACNVIALVPLAGAFDIGNNRIAQAFNLAIPYDCSGGTSLYASLISRSGHTFFTQVGDLQLILHVERN